MSRMRILAAFALLLALGLATREVSASTAPPTTVVASERVLDTRAGSGPLLPGTVLPLATPGALGSSILLDVTAVGASGPGSVTVWSCAMAKPSSPTLFVRHGAVTTNRVVLPASAAGACIASTVAVQVVADVTARIAGADLRVVRPTHLPSGSLGAGTEVRVRVAGRGRVGRNAALAAIELTVTSPASDGLVSVHPCGGAAVGPPMTFAAGQSTAALAVTTLSGRDVCVRSTPGVDVTLDAMAWSSTTRALVAFTPGTPPAPTTTTTPPVTSPAPTTTAPSTTVAATTTTTALPPTTTTTMAPLPTTTTTMAPLPTTTTTKAPPPTTTTTTTGAPAAHFSLLGVGAALPAEATCASQVRRGGKEARPDNATYNQTKGHATAADPSYPRFARVTGNFTGTTDELIQWAACKWGIDEDVLRAQVAKESWWHQNAAGDLTSDPSICAPGHPIGADGHPGQCPESMGLLQVRTQYFRSTINDAIASSAYNLDVTLAVWRTCFEGEETWLNTVERGQQYAAGDLWGCIGRWFAGRWHTAPAETYIAAVKDNLAQKVWAQPGF